MEPTQKTDTPDSGLSLHDKLEAEAQAADLMEVEQPEETSSAQQDAEKGETEEATRAAASGTEKEDKPDNPEPSADKSEKPRDSTGKFVKKDAAQTEGETETAPEDKAAVKAAKEQERKDRTWQNIEREKAEVRETQARLARLENELRQLAQRPAQNEGVKFDSKQYSRASYGFAERAKKLFRDGDIDGGMEQFALAEQTSQAAHEAAQGEAAYAEQQAWEKFGNSMAGYVSEHSEFGDPDAEETKRMTAAMQDDKLARWLRDHPYGEGFKFAGDYIRRELGAAEASGLREQVAQLTKEIERLTKDATPASTKDAARHTAVLRAEEMPIKDLHDKLKREAELADAY